MRIHYVQHVPFEGPGFISRWIKQRAATVTCTRLYEDEMLPPPDQFDLLVVMGGPMSVNDEAKFPWLIAEKKLIREAARSDKAIVGVCLGAQLIASALGARVYPIRAKEIGWFPISSAQPSASPPRFCFPPSTTVFHWHGETFDLPPGATLLARSSACENQAFQLGERVIALQFHLETTPESLLDIVSHCRDELVPAPYVQAEEVILNPNPSIYAAMHGLMNDILDFVTRDETAFPR